MNDRAAKAAVARRPSMDAIGGSLQRAVDSRAVPCAVAMVAAGEQQWSWACGPRHAGASPIGLDSVFWIASMTKPITSVAAMQLVERGRLDLDAPLGRLVPDLAEPQVLEGFTDEGRPILRPARRPITLRQLLTHTSGFAYPFTDAALLRYVQTQGLPDITTCTREAFRLPLSFDPGERWHYGIGLDWVGRVVEAASGQGFEDYVKAHILGPLGMVDTAFTLTPAMRARQVGMHARLPDGSLAAIPFEVVQSPEFCPAGGGLYGTARDYMAFLQMLLNGGEHRGVRILRPETVRLMQTNQIGALRAGAMRSAMPEFTHDLDAFPGMDTKWGLGFLINPEPSPFGRSGGSLSWAGLANTYFWLDPARRVCAVLLSQFLPFADPQMLAVAVAFERAVYDALDAA